VDFLFFICGSEIIPLVILVNWAMVVLWEERHNTKWGWRRHHVFLSHKNIVRNKIYNTYQILRRNAQSDCFDERKRQRLKDMMLQLEDATTRERIRGLEGSAANMYFEMFDAMLKREGRFW
jgi:CRISPR/Cas system-associated endonuclease Cas1